MYRKIFCVIALVSIAVLLKAQVNMTLQVPATGVVQKTQLWNMVLISSTEGSTNVYISLSFLSARDNRVLMNAVTKPFLLTKGAKQITASDLSPIQYNYLSSVFNIDLSPDGFLPFGNYKVCYTVFSTDKNISTPLTEECIPVEVQPLSPPLLNNPLNGDTLSNIYPQFTWLPATPLNLFNSANYEMQLVEVFSGQTPGDAIQKNVPVYIATHCQAPFFNYPASAKSLDTNHLYAWRVIVKNEDEFVAESETWVFRVKQTTQAQPLFESGNYALLQKDVQGIYTVQDDTLRVKYFSYTPTFKAFFNFFDEQGNIISTEKRNVSPGYNYINFHISKSLAEEKTYMLSMITLDNKKEVLRFSIPKKSK